MRFVVLIVFDVSRDGIRLNASSADILRSSIDHNPTYLFTLWAFSLLAPVKLRALAYIFPTTTK